MKARTKILLLTSGFALITALGFSTVVLYQLLEQPIRLVDTELFEVSEALHDNLSRHQPGAKDPEALLTRHPFDKYWVIAKDRDGTLIRHSEMSHNFAIEFRPDDSYFFTLRRGSVNALPLTDEHKREIRDITGKGILFRVFNETYSAADGRQYQLIVARPIPLLLHEVKELVVGVLGGIAICTAVVLFAAYYLAGTILRPIATVNTQIGEITSSSLHKRLPVSANKDELQTLARSLNSMFDRLEYSFERQKEFIGNASHELKSPLTILMLNQEKMLSEPLPEDVQAGLAKQLHTTRRLSRLVHSLLEISRLEQRDSFQPVRLALREIVEILLDDFSELFAAHDIKVTSKLETVVVHGDEQKISQLIINLLDNAIKYNQPSGGTIDIELSRRENQAVLRIANSGEAIPEASLCRIFDQFYRVEKSRSTELGGSGLGLTIVKQIVELHQGTIDVHNESQGLVVFTVTLPA